MRVFGKLGYTILDAKVHTTRHNFALDTFVLQNPGGDAHYRDHLALIEHELSTRLSTDAPIDRPTDTRLSRKVRHFPVAPAVRLRADDSGKHYILTLTAADRPGLLFDIADTLAYHEVSVLAAKISTLGERVEDTFLVTGRGLSSDTHVLRVERDLIDKLKI